MTLPTIPIISTLSGATKAAGEFFVATLKAFFEGLSICVANPVVFLVIAAAFGGGVWAGIDWDRHKVETAVAATTAMRAHVVQLQDTAKSDRGEVLELATKAKTLESELARLKAAMAPKSEAMAAVSRPRVAKAPAKKPAADEAPKVPFWPFQN